MLSLIYGLYPAAILASIVVASSAQQLEPRAGGCADKFSNCSPKGATSTDTPAIGTDLSPLYTDLLTSVNGVKTSKRDALEARDELSLALESRATSSNLCCESQLQ